MDAEQEPHLQRFFTPRIVLCLVQGAATPAASGSVRSVYMPKTALLGNLGPVIGWIAFLSGALIISNAWALKTGEWRGYERPKKVMLLGSVVLVLSVALVGYANGLA
ncbi:hypothetical protein SGGMMB4_00411 [Sodalis glossinidius str. 'morsitans']|uniref:Uncharacterized protein n=1 Tax=Sodalis glossinidius (strain morsitans) TaxID=343509 RepID=A0A193QF69_SODGM|nr:hypothetical protein [Sodalis glossinidius]CRL43798.1 hypothetical protein SGGMMB4_00411 [Sodalis glossinidius str. 'morsitans']